MNTDENENELNLPKLTKISITLAHEIFSHMGGDQMGATDKHPG